MCGPRDRCDGSENDPPDRGYSHGDDACSASTPETISVHCAEGRTVVVPDTVAAPRPRGRSHSSARDRSGRWLKHCFTISLIIILPC